MIDTPREFWIRIDPTGCVTGSVRESAVGPLAEDAHKEFTPRIANRRKEAAAGWRHELIGRDEWTRRAEPCLLGRCGHHKATSAATGGATNG
ncbi:hypothetical protein AB0L71_28395 [Streptomyces sp. NPDC052052]|uniref:hypothetical protein n=1 Tax=Streptomyces sp. NPDC052052 TaxID=3154756 RepID=UPI003441155D